MIRISHLRKTFGDLVAVDDLSMDIHAGEILGLLGPNGAGKTTTIRMLCGLLDPDEGEIRWASRAPRSELLGFCPQENLHWPRLTCLEQMTFFGSMHGMSQLNAQKRGKELLELLGLKAKQDVLASNLSGGMQRRLNIALALIHDPPILILDEPEAGLDPQSRILIRDLIRSLAREKTVIITTHNMDEAERLADRVAIIDQGRLLEQGSVNALKESLGSGDCLECGFEKNLEEPAFLAALRQTFQIPEQALKVTGDKLLIPSFQHLENLAALTELASSHGLEIMDIQVRKTTLEDVFIHLTGRGLRE